MDTSRLLRLLVYIFNGFQYSDTILSKLRATMTTLSTKKLDLYIFSMLVFILAEFAKGR